MKYTLPLSERSSNQIKRSLAKYVLKLVGCIELYAKQNKHLRFASLKQLFRVNGFVRNQMGV